MPSIWILPHLVILHLFDSVLAEIAVESISSSFRVDIHNCPGQEVGVVATVKQLTRNSMPAPSADWTNQFSPSGVDEYHPFAEALLPYAKIFRMSGSICKLQNVISKGMRNGWP
ncbi:hypothetical protein TELCIR_11173 [Teladorsagia circumcincta]|uniref:Transthyretin-like family protein n=1 Tax=Teladorsagia circumcincta TaxID=45464 RepID=A0A2G9UA53_TELCI|nr:hypothetical protein TELCIR_11173 [Teladorsagia circumcincta]